MHILQERKRIGVRRGVEPTALMPNFGRRHRTGQEVKRRRSIRKKGKPPVGVEIHQRQLELDNRFRRIR
jgi:hypothetical protein